MKLLPFQKQDLARAALHDGLILSWDTGLWKTGGGYLWPLLKCGFSQTTEPGPRPPLVPSPRPWRLRPNHPVLLVVPGDLHLQTAREGVEKFNIETIPITGKDDFRELTRRPHSLLTHVASDGRAIVPPGFYITSYTQLTTNGVESMPDPRDWPDIRALQTWLCLPTGQDEPTIQKEARLASGDLPRWDTRPEFESVAQFFAWRGIRWDNEYQRLGLDPEDSLKELEVAYSRELEATRAIRDPKLAARECAKVEEANQILRQLMTLRPCPKYSQLSGQQQDFVIRAFIDERLLSYDQNNGATREYPIGEKPEGYVEGAPETDTRPKWRVKCLYSPSMADLSYDAFECVAVDEGVKMKGEDTLVGKGVRQMTPKYRLVLTATPVKNRLPDIFRLAWWAAGGRQEAHARWPYRDDSSEREKFARTFMVSERNLSRMAKEMAGANGAERHILRALKAGEAQGRQNSRYTKLTAEVCNIHLLWKLFGPIVLRRRKDDCGADIVPKIRKVIRCEMGTHQQRAYQYHLQANYVDCNGQKAIGAQLQALRTAAADPSSNHLQPQIGEPTEDCTCRNGARATCPRCHGSGRIPLPHISGAPYTPKMATTLRLIQEILDRKEQVVVFSAFHDPLDRLSGWLDEAGVRHVTLDGRVSQKRRGTLAAAFKRGRILPSGGCGAAPLAGSAATPVMLAGVECMAEGHSFHLANNVILIAYSWAYDKFIQAINRVHRLNSPKPVNVYVVICNGTIDRKLESLVGDKGDAAELVLDGRLIGERNEEVNLAELLRIAQAEFNSENKTIDEALLQAGWPELRGQLACAMRAWDALPAVPTARQDLNSPFSQPEISTPKLNTQTMRRNLILNIPIPTAPSHQPPVARINPATPAPVQTPAPQPSWRERMRQRADRLAQMQKADLWAQL
jgi:hypothetical protein